MPRPSMGGNNVDFTNFGRGNISPTCMLAGLKYITPSCRWANVENIHLLALAQGFQLQVRRPYVPRIRRIINLKKLLEYI